MDVCGGLGFIMLCLGVILGVMLLAGIYAYMDRHL